MAIARGAGTEIIRCVNLTDMDASGWHSLIIGEQHHIYTVLSIVVFAHYMAVNGGALQLRLVGWDAKNATSGTVIQLLEHPMNESETFVWDNKFSFNGYAPVDWGSDAMDSIADQNAIADQGHATAYQSLQCLAGHTNDEMHVVCTYIDQNNA